MTGDNRKKIDVVLLSGFLGAGKTTLLRRILSWETDLSGTVVVVNDFGKIGIDGALLRGRGSEVVELTGGCICCTLGADLIRTLGRVRDRFAPRRILVECSGVSDPGAVTDALNHPDLAASMNLFKTIAVLDADDWESREVFGRVFYRQLEAAHLILLNKIDLLEENNVAALLEEIRARIPGVGLIPTIQCRVDPEALWAARVPGGQFLKPMAFYTGDSDRNDSIRRGAESAESPNGPVTADQYNTFSYEGDAAFREECFKRFLDTLPVGVFRVKGPVKFADRTLLLNHVSGKTEWSGWSGAPATRLAFIGWGASETDTLSAMKKCLEQPLSRR